MAVFFSLLLSHISCVIITLMVLTDGGGTSVSIATEAVVALDPCSVGSGHVTAKEWRLKIFHCWNWRHGRFVLMFEKKFMLFVSSICMMWLYISTWDPTCCSLDAKVFMNILKSQERLGLQRSPSTLLNLKKFDPSHKWPEVTSSDFNFCTDLGF